MKEIKKIFSDFMFFLNFKKNFVFDFYRLFLKKNFKKNVVFCFL